MMSLAMAAGERANVVAATLARGLLLSGLVESREGIVPLLRQKATGATLDTTRWFDLADRSERLNALTALIPTELRRDTAQAAAVCQAVAAELHTLSAMLGENPQRAEELLPQVDQQILDALPDLVELDKHRQRTIAAAEGGDEVSSEAVRRVNEAFSERAMEQALETWRRSDRYAAAIAAGLVGATSAQAAESGRTVEEVRADLDALVGLSGVKQEVHSLLNLLSINKQRQASGLESTSVTLHVVFAGPPGTGKTTVARLYGELLRAIGLLAKGHVKEVARQDLVAGYVGQTAVKTNAVIDESLDGVLFIDEAYSLTPDDSSQDFGHEAVEVLLKRMEDDRERLAVIAAGYTAEMERFITSNPGLESRFTQTITFPSYGPEELLTIFHRQVAAAGFKTESAAHEAAWRHLYAAWRDRDERFGNGRYVRRLFELCLKHQANRLAGEAAPSPLQLVTLVGEDVPAYG